MSGMEKMGDPCFLKILGVSLRELDASFRSREAPDPHFPHLRREVEGAGRRSPNQSEFVPEIAMRSIMRISTILGVLGALLCLSPSAQSCHLCHRGYFSKTVTYGAPPTAGGQGYGYATGTGYGYPSATGYGYPSATGYGYHTGLGYGYHTGLGYGYPVGAGYGYPAGTGYGYPAGTGYGYQGAAQGLNLGGAVGDIQTLAALLAKLLGPVQSGGNSPLPAGLFPGGLIPNPGPAKLMVDVVTHKGDDMPSTPPIDPNVATTLAGISAQLKSLKDGQDAINARLDRGGIAK